MALLRLKQFLRRNATSLPYLSGDGFASLARESKNQVLFCKSEMVERTLEKLRDVDRPFVLVAGNSDREFILDKFTLPNNLRRMYLQNSFITQNELIRTLPIGVENFKHSMNGLPSLFQPNISYEKKVNKIFIGPFGRTHPEREALMQIRTSSRLVVQSDRLSPKAYAEQASFFRFVACPRGNGVDTHRLWETLYRGSRPILLRNDWASSLEYLGLPLILVDSWSEIDLLNALEQNSGLDSPAPNNLEFLWADAWEKLFRHDLV